MIWQTNDISSNICLWKAEVGKTRKMKWDHTITNSDKKCHIVGDRKIEVFCHSSNMINM